MEAVSNKPSVSMLLSSSSLDLLNESVALANKASVVKVSEVSVFGRRKAPLNAAIPGWGEKCKGIEIISEKMLSTRADNPWSPGLSGSSMIQTF